MGFLTDSFNATLKTAKTTAPASAEPPTASELASRIAKAKEAVASLQGSDVFSLSPALLKRLLANEKLTTDETKLCAALCKSIGYL
jgi:hypothetical protein